MGKLKDYKLYYIFILFILLLLNTNCTDADAQVIISRPKIGMVLGGGGAKGAAEIGVLKVIEEVGLPIDYIAGTSIGAVIGGLYSCGYKAENLDSLFRTRKWSKLMADPSAKFDGIISGKKIVSTIEDLIGYDDSISFDSLPIPFRCVAVDERSEKEIVLSEGKLSKAMRASMSVPILFDPLVLDSMRLVDGGVLNNLPVDVVRKMGADIVIAIDLTQNKREPREYKWKRKKGIGWIIEWVRKRPDLVKYNTNRKDADIYINPDLKGYSAKSFYPRKIKEMIAIGWRTGNEARTELIELKRRIHDFNGRF